jgi:hypothetical protein
MLASTHVMSVATIIVARVAQLDVTGALNET